LKVKQLDGDGRNSRARRIFHVAGYIGRTHLGTEGQGHAHKHGDDAGVFDQKRRA